MKISFFRIIFVLVFFLSPFIVLAGTEHNLSGWAWSDNIGWISFNSTNDHDSNTAGVQPSSINYGVNYDSQTGFLTGYAWANPKDINTNNIGWIKFGELSNFPVGGGTQPKNATMDNNGNLTGWAKALSADPNTGWDGFISLSGAGYGVTLTDTASSFCTTLPCPNHDFAWGSDVVGWVDFSGVVVGADVVDSCGTGSGTTPLVAEPVTGIFACGHGDYINSPSDTPSLWKWSCGTINTCSAPKSCTTDNSCNSNPPDGVSDPSPGAGTGASSECPAITEPQFTCSQGGQVGDKYTSGSVWTWTCTGNAVGAEPKFCSKNRNSDVTEDGSGN